MKKESLKSRTMSEADYYEIMQLEKERLEIIDRLKVIHARLGVLNKKYNRDTNED